MIHTNRMRTVGVLVALATASVVLAADGPTVLRCVLQSPGGDLPFRMELVPAGSAGGPAQAVIHNGSERIAIEGIEVRADSLRIPFAHYASEITATSADGGATWSGAWTKRGRAGKESRLALTAAADPGYRFAPLPAPEEPVAEADIAGRWQVEFSQDKEVTIGQFHRLDGGGVEGTFLTPGGDYRYLAGSFEYGRLRLSTFDGSHAYLFDALLLPDGTLEGGFWAGDTVHEAWTARRAADAKLPDGFSLAHATSKADPAALRFTDLDGRERTLAELIGDGKACILEIFGSWCPNCHDASHLLDELQAKYGERGLRVVGVAFEFTGDVKQDAKQVRKFIEHCHATYPVVYGGLADREEVARKLPFLGALKAYPTTIFLRADGTVTAIHTGFSGPATGDAYTAQRKAFEDATEQMLRPS